MSNERTPSYLMASYLRDTVKTDFEPGADHLARMYEAAMVVERHAALVAGIRSALDALDKCSALSDDHEAKEILRATLSRATP